MRLLAIDPSGEWDLNSQGVTGLCFYETPESFSTGRVYADNAQSKMEYWEHVLRQIPKMHPDAVICEDFILYNSKQSALGWDSLNTARLVGCIEHTCYVQNIPLILQRAVDVKERWVNTILEHKNLIMPYKNTKSWQLCSTNQVLTDHELDALRHLMHALTFNKRIKEILENGNIQNKT